MKSKTLFESFCHAFAGLFYLVKAQRNARIHLLATLLTIALGLWLDLPFLNWIFISIAIALVWIAELFNTSIEKLFDLLQPGDHDLVRIGKDTSAAAVLITALLSVVVGIISMGPLLIQKIFNP